MNDCILDEIARTELRLWGRWASCRPPEPNGRCYSAEGRWVAPSDHDAKRNGAAPPMSAYDRSRALFTERVILTQPRLEIGALCVCWAGMDMREVWRIYRLRGRGFDKILGQAHWTFQNRWREAIRFDNIAREFSAQIGQAKPTGADARSALPSPQAPGALTGTGAFLLVE